MSIAALAYLYDHSGLSGSDLAVACFLAFKESVEGGAYPSVPTIAKSTGMSVGNVRKTLSRLRKAGIIQAVGSTEQGVTRYRICQTPLSSGTGLSDTTALSNGTVPPYPIGAEPLSNGTVPPYPVEQPIDNERKERKFIDNSLVQKTTNEDELVSVKVKIDPPTETTIKGKLITSKPRERKAGNKSSDADFEQFWQQCPRKVGKGGAKNAFQTALKKTDLQTLLAGIMRYSAECDKKGTEAQFIAHPQTWLNQGRWDDEPDPCQAPARGLNRQPSPLEIANALVDRKIENGYFGGVQ